MAREIFGKLILQRRIFAVRTFVARRELRRKIFTVQRRRRRQYIRRYRILSFLRTSILVTDTPLSPMGPSSPSQEGLFTDLRLVSLEKQLNIELKVNVVCWKDTIQCLCTSKSQADKIFSLRERIDDSTRYQTVIKISKSSRWQHWTMAITRQRTSL